MDIRLKRITLQNFKCFRSKEIEFDKDITTIQGRNGAGKTTIADAILFCLFGKNTAGQNDLDIFKTRENGQVIPNLEHSVEIQLRLINYAANIEKAVNLKRSIKEVWVKRRGSDESVFKNNTCEYFVNGESYTLSDYKKYINSLIDEETFRIITSPTYFTSKKWQEQREFLSRMVGEILPEEIADNQELAALVSQLNASGEEIEAYRKHLSYQIKQIKDKLEKIPVRLEEQNKALPEKLDWDKLQSELDDVKKIMEDTDEKIFKINSGNGADVKREELKKEISEIRERMNKIESVVHSEYNGAVTEKQREVSKMTLAFNEALNNQKLIEQAIEADNKLIQRCNLTISECDVHLQRLRDSWPNRKFVVDQNASICPTCGQPLPADVVDGKIEHMREEFNKALEQEKQSLREKAAKENKDKEEAAEELKRLADKLKSDSEQLSSIKEEINRIFAKKSKAEKAKVASYEERLQETQWPGLQKQVDELTTQMENISESDSNNELAGLKAKSEEANNEFIRLQYLLGQRQQYERGQKLIEGIYEEQKSLISQLSELERSQDVANQYQFRMNQILEERINKHFKLVQWRMFKTINNGGDSFEEPFCECYVDGVPFHAGLNQAMRLNAGLDICEALCRLFNVSAPIVIDNAESNLNIYQTTGQQIRLQVFDSELNQV